MDRLQALHVFAAVADAESFVGGARTLGLSGPSATRAVNELEDALGARLFTRTTRRVRLTDVGRGFAEEVREVLAHLRAAEDTVTGAAQRPTGLLRITAPQEFGRLYIAPLVAEFLDAWPEVKAELLLVDRPVNLVEEGYDVALRIGDLPSSALLGVRVGYVRRVVCGAPSYLARYGRPEDPAELAESHRLIVTGTAVREWRFGLDQRMAVRLDPQLCVNSVAASIGIAQQGWGLCRVLSYQVAEDLEAGRLVAVLERHEPAPAPVHILHPGGRKTPAKLRAFIDFAAERLRRLPALKRA
ncbi:MAG: LysR family transcriptional regulator [Rhodobacteraceae bacterium]|nr:LysR family transcriptional regulator [Paracoccaceae bacterium]